MSEPVMLWETKTSSESIAFGSTFWKKTTLDPQISLYIPALRAIGYDPRGCVYDVLRKPQLKPSDIPILDADGIKIVLDQNGQRVRTKDGKKWRQTGDAELRYVLQSRPETPEEFGARCLDAIAEKPDYYYARGIVVRLQADEREAAVDVWQTASQMRESRRLNVYPRNPDSCTQYGRECDYLNVCSGVADINNDLLFKTEVANVEIDGSDDLSLLSQSAMRSYRKCQRMYQLRYVMRRRPNVKAATLSTGSSIHKALQVFRETGGDLPKALAALLTEDPFVRAKEAAMVTGYFAMWGAPTGFITDGIEKSFRIPLINPETGGTSRTWSLGGQMDGVVHADAVKDLMNPAPPVPPEMLAQEQQLSMATEQGEGNE